MNWKTLLRSTVPGLIATGFLFSATPAVVGQSFTVDFSNDRGEITHAMSGWLYSWWHTRPSPAHGNLEVNATSWRIGYWGTWDYEYQPMLDAGIGHIQIILSDVFRNRGTGNWGGFAHDPSWQSLSYPETVAKTVELVNKNNWDKIAFDLINEPDAFGGETGGDDWFNNAWVPAFRTIRELRPQAEIVGPGFFSPNLAHMRSFLEKAKEANVVPDIIAQHLLDSGSNSVVEDFDTAIRGLLDEYGLAQRPISFNEYINPGNVRFVQRRIETISQGERVGVHSAMHSSWDDSGELPPWNSTGDWPSLDGIMSIPAERERAPYWVYKFYGDMSGRLVWTSGNPNAWEGMATMDLSEPGNPVARFMLGGSNAGSNVTVNLNNIPAEFGNPVDVLIERVHTSGNEDLWSGPIQHSRQNRTVNDGSLSFSLSGLPWGVAVMVTVKRADLPPQVAQPQFSPYRGAYWKPIDVTLSTATPGATIRYTLDGSEPTESSPVYTGPIDVPVTKFIRAVAFKEGMAPSEAANGGFKIYKYYNGVYGEYFANTTLSGEPVLTRGDRDVNQRFGGARWDAALPHANFSSRWSGRLRPAHSGIHQLHIEAIDGARLWVDGDLLIDEWRVQSRRTHSVSIDLVGGRDYDIRMEHFDGSGGDKIAILKWTPPGGTEEVIPSARLFPPTAPAGDDLLIPAGTTWNYLAPSGPGDAPPAGWQDPAFDDSSWAAGPARIGYGNQGEMTAIQTSPYRPKALYFRRTFTVEDPSALAATLRLQLMRDDGAVLYLNGEELLRDNMPEGEIGYGTFATAPIGTAWRRMPVRYLLPREKLLPGENTIAVEVHNASASGNDVGFDLWLYNPTRVTIPEVGPIPDHQAFPGEPMPAISFSVDDGEVWASSLTTSATSSNPGLIPNETIETWGWGRSRLVSFTPSAGQTGTAEITVTVDNGLETGSRTFTVTVVEPPENTAPTIGPVADRIIEPGIMSNEFRFDVDDAETEPGLLVVTATSSNQTLVPDGNLYINGTGDWRTISIRPVAGHTGASEITLTVGDGELSATETFTVTVPTPPPTISDISDQSILVNTSTGPLSFTVGHAEGGEGELTVSGFSSNLTLVPNANIVFGGSGANRTVTVTPAPDRTGAAIITVTVADQEATASTNFMLTVASDEGPVVYEFDDGTFSDWTESGTDGQGRQYFAVVPPGLNSPNTTPQSGSHFIGLHIPAFGGGYTQDSPHDTLILSSPEFTLNGSGDLTAWLSGGGPGAPNLAGTSVAALPATSTDGGFRGVALRNVTTGTFALSRSKTSEGNAWQQVTITAAQLAALPQDHVYTLDLIDAAHGGWGWVNMDTVTIPGTLVEDPGAADFPLLMIHYREQNEVRLSWPAGASGWTLQRAPEPGGEYTDAGLEVNVEGDENVVYDTITSTRQFYRLVR